MNRGNRGSKARRAVVTLLVATVVATAVLVATVPTGAFAATGIRSLKALTLDGETLTATTTVLTPSAGCGLQQAGSVNFSASGTATGPYPGTFTETGNWSFDLITEQTFETSFTITSGTRVLSGILLYDQTSTGPDGRSLVQNLGGCGYSNAGGAYSTCSQQQLTGACAGQSVAFIYPDSFFQTFSKPSGGSTMVITGGNQQTAGVSTANFTSEFPQPLSVRVTDANGAGVPGVVVTWLAAARNPTGSPAGPWTGTDWNGDASVNVFAGVTAGTYSVTAKGSKRTRAVFTLTNV